MACQNAGRRRGAPFMSAFRYPRPLICDPSTPGALPLAGGWAFFAQVELLSRSEPARVIAATDLPEKVLDRLTRTRVPQAGLQFDAPKIMGILNVTPDSFSDGGLFQDHAAALTQIRAMAKADILDIGGESTRPSAAEVEIAEEIARTAPVIEAIAAETDTPISIDTRKARVAQAAVDAGAKMINDVSGLDFDAEMAGMMAKAGVPVCLMHAQGTPETMQADPRYENVLLDVFDALEARRDRAVAAGVALKDVMLDPGIGFGKTLAHNLQLVQGLSLFHALGCPLLLGVSRKGFIGKLGDAPNPADRMPGSVALGLVGATQGVQVLRVHDVEETAQAFALWSAVSGDKT